MSIEERPVERRRVTRQKSFLRGMIYFNNRRNVVDCLIRDISPYGARLIFSDAVSTPDVFELYIPQKEQTLRIHVIWRHGQEVGVAFAQATLADHLTQGGTTAVEGDAKFGQYAHPGRLWLGEDAEQGMLGAEARDAGTFGPLPERERQPGGPDT